MALSYSRQERGQRAGGGHMSLKTRLGQACGCIRDREGTPGHPTGGSIDDSDGDERTRAYWKFLPSKILESLTHYRSSNIAVRRYSHACYTHVYSDILLAFAMGS